MGAVALVSATRDVTRLVNRSAVIDQLRATPETLEKLPVLLESGEPRPILRLTFVDHAGNSGWRANALAKRGNRSSVASLATFVAALSGAPAP